MPTWSHSRLQAYEDCPQKFKFQYIDQIKPTKKSIYAYMGNIVHKVLELLYKDLHFDKITPLEKLIQDFEQLWDTNRTTELIIPYDRTEEDFKQLGRRCIENYYQRNHPFDQGSTLGIEEQVLLELEDGIKFQGYIDRISRRTDGTIEIHDYKTGGRIPSQAQLDEDRQLTLYQLAIMQKWPDTKSTELVWHYVAFGEELHSRRTSEQLEKVKQDVIAVIRQIERDQDFEPRKSDLCSYCEYQPICPLWKNLFEVEAMSDKEKQADIVVQIVDRYGDLKIQEAQIKMEIERLQGLLAEFPTKAKVKSLFGTKWSVTMRRTENIAIPRKGDPKREAVETIIKNFGVWEQFSVLNTMLLKSRILENTLKTELLEAVDPLVVRRKDIRFSCSSIRENYSKSD